MVQRPSLVGQQFGSYKLLRLLGAGGFAEVYLGEHIDLGTQAAIKVLHTKLDPTDIEAFRTEARTIARLRYPHIIRVLDFNAAGSTPFLVMDYAVGGTMRQRYPRGTIVPLATIISSTRQVADALQYAHNEKIIHRDIKPENILLDQHSNVLLSDFGIALIAQSSRSQNTQDVIGTAAYMSPEQIQGKPRPASDQYSLGIVVYEWLSGARPFEGSLTELWSQHMFTPPPPLREKAPTISPEIELVVMTALSKDPKERFASVSAFTTALVQASQDMLPTEQRHSLNLSSSVPIPPITATVPISPSNQLAQSTVTIVTQPSVPTREKTTDKPTISRRAVLIGTAGAAATVVGGIGVFAITRQQNPVVQSPLSTVTSQRQPFTYTGHLGAVLAVAWSPDGKRIVSGSADTSVQAWNANDGSGVLIYRGHSDWVWSVAWSPDGRRIASGSADSVVQVWNASNGGNVFSYRDHTDVIRAVAWSPSGQRIASGGYDKTVQVWDAVDGSHILTYRGHSDAILALAWSPNGKYVASVGGRLDPTVQVWNATDGSNIFTYHGHSSDVEAVAWSPDGKRIASASYDLTVQVWNAADGGNVLTYRNHFDHVRAVVWSPDGMRIASGGESIDKTVQVWNATDGGNIYIYRGHTGSVNALAWLPYGKWIASGSDDKTVQVFSAM